MKKLLTLLLSLAATVALAQSSGINGGGPNTLPGSGPANQVLATPASSAGNVSLRALTSADIPALTSTQVTSSFTGTCNSSTYLNGGGSCTAPIITGVVASAVTCSGGGGSCGLISFSGLAAAFYGLDCYIDITAASGGTMFIGLGFGGMSGYFSDLAFGSATVAGSSGALAPGTTPVTINTIVELRAWVQSVTGGGITVALNSATGAQTITAGAGSYCTLVKP